MNFVQSEFAWFMVAVLLLYWAVPRVSWQNLVLLVASAVFYGWIHPWWLLLLYGSALLDFAMARLMVRSPAYKRLWLAISLTGNLGLLFTFKYLDFFVENVAAAIHAAGFSTSLHGLGLLLPAGISFYTFQTMSYTTDAYRGELRPRRDLVDYLVFISFFPQLMAGPIERATRLLPQLEKARVFRVADLRAGFGLALYGAFKKVVIADTIAPYVDKVFVHEDPSGPMIHAATTGFMLQIYADFSGYTDIARGTARMLGVELSRNFDEPYLAASTPEFWQRWHMSLSSWIRDYLLAPLLGDGATISRRRFLGAVFLTMVVMGAWHGAGWNYLLFGLFHAVAIAVYVGIGRGLPDRVRGLAHGRTLAAVVHLLVVGQIGALLFRETSVERLVRHLTTNPLAGTSDAWRVAVALWGLVLVLGSVFAVEHYARRWVIPRVEPTHWYLPLQTTAWAVYLVLMFVFYRITAYDFIYFQF